MSGQTRALESTRSARLLYQRIAAQVLAAQGFCRAPISTLRRCGARCVNRPTLHSIACRHGSAGMEEDTLWPSFGSNTHRELVRAEIADPEQIVRARMLSIFLRATAVTSNGLVPEGDDTMVTHDQSTWRFHSARRVAARQTLAHRSSPVLEPHRRFSGVDGEFPCGSNQSDRALRVPPSARGYRSGQRSVKGGFRGVGTKSG